MSTNPLYYRLIEHFRDLTGVPMLLNTSFNENEPVVKTNPWCANLKRLSIASCAPGWICW